MTRRMATEDQAPAPFDRLVAREVERVREELERAHARALADNPEGNALLAGALRDALLLGLEAGCRRAGRSVDELDYGASDGWERWRAERARSPEGREWPADLEAIAPDALARARELLVDAGTVRVAVAANQAEAELLQGVLADAEIPSTWRRTGGDLPDLLAAGYREIYVPAAAADEAQALLATLEAVPADDEPEPTRRIGLERTGLRLIGKVAAALVVASPLASVALGLVTENAVLGIVVFLAMLVAAGAAVLWSERAGRA
jgi:hypothetical protein